MSRKQGSHNVGMRPTARADGSLRSNGVPAGLLLARVAASIRLAVCCGLFQVKEKAR